MCSYHACAICKHQMLYASGMACVSVTNLQLKSSETLEFCGRYGHRCVIFIYVYIAQRSCFVVVFSSSCAVWIWVLGCLNFDYLVVRVILSSLICGLKCTMQSTINNNISERFLSLWGILWAKHMIWFHGSTKLI